MDFVKLSLLCATVLLGLDVALGQDNYNQWFEGRATFYGGASGSDTHGGACGYKNLFQMGIGMNNAAAASVLWKGGNGCGGCFEVKCNQARSGKYCIQGKSVVITVTNMCPRGGVGWCNPPNKHFDMSQPAYTQIAIYKSGVVATLMRRVPCKRNGKITFITGGNPWFFSITVYNLAGYGEVRGVEAQADKPNAKWWTLSHNWGAVFSVSKWFYRVPVNIRITAGNGKVLFIKRALPDGWNIGSTYAAGQFGPGSSLRRRLSRRKSSSGLPTQLPSVLSSRSLGSDFDAAVTHSNADDVVAFELGDGRFRPLNKHPILHSDDDVTRIYSSSESDALENSLENASLEGVKSELAQRNAEVDSFLPSDDASEFSSNLGNKIGNFEEVRNLLASRDDEEKRAASWLRKENPHDLHFIAKHQRNIRAEDLIPVEVESLSEAENFSTRVGDVEVTTSPLIHPRIHASVHEAQVHVRPEVESVSTSDPSGKFQTSTGAGN